MAWWWPFGKKEERKEQKRIYQGAIYNRLTSDWLASSTSADSEIVSSIRTLRNRVRSLCRDNDYAKGAVRTICNNIVGKGIPLQAKVKQKRGEKYDERINKEIEALWEEWGSAEFCDCAGKLDFSDIERLAMRSLIESGEVLIRLVRKSFDDSPVPLALELIESDQLADDQWSGTAENGNEIRMGVEIDKWGRAQAYHLYEKHPGDFQFTSSVGQRLIRVPASEIIHLFICDRPGQTRGVPWFHSALTTFRHVGGYTEAELVAARAQAAVMGFITTPDTDVYAPEEMAGQRVTSLEPGAIEVLNPGESFEGFAPTRPNQGFDAFIRMMLRGVAAGIGLSYEALSRDFSNTSYSSARTSLMDERDNYRVIQSWLIRRLHKRIYKKWLDLAVLSGSLKIGDYELNRRFYQKAKFTPRGWQWVDPQNEIAANKEGVKAGFVSITDVVAQQGLDVEDVLQEQKRILDLAKDLGLSLDVLAEGGEQEPPPPAEGMTPVRIMPELTRTFSSQQRAKSCKKGIACGNACIAKNRVCKQNLPPIAQQQVPLAKAKVKVKITKTVSSSSQSLTPKAGSIAEIDPSLIKVDPKRFQYKIIGEQTQTGTVGSLSGVKTYDPNLAGILQVWVDPSDGETYVVNGHNRLDLAKKLGATAVAVRYLGVADAKEARAVEALTNIAEGRGTALDAAKFMRDTGLTRDDLQKKGIPMREKVATEGMALANLEDSLFRKAIDGDLTIERAAIIGGSGLSPDKQKSVYNLAEKEKKKVTNEVLTELIDTVKSSESSQDFQLDLFGGSSVTINNAIEKASLQASIKRKLSKDKKLFGTVGKAKAAQQLAQAGNTIDVAKSKSISDDASKTLQVFDTLKNLSGPISQSLNTAANKIQSGGDRKKIESELYDEIKNLVLQTVN